MTIPTTALTNNIVSNLSRRAIVNGSSNLLAVSAFQMPSCRMNIVSQRFRSSLTLFGTKAHHHILPTITSTGATGGFGIGTAFNHHHHPNLVRNTNMPRCQMASTETTDQQQQESIIGIDWLRDEVVQVLQQLYDYKEVAAGSALAKLDGGKKKKKKKKKKGGDEEVAIATAEEEVEKPPVVDRQAVIEEAKLNAKPFGQRDSMVTQATKAEFGDYQCNAAMGLAKSLGKQPRECAAEIIEGLRPILGDIMEEPEIAGPGFINLRFKETYLSDAICRMAKDSENRLAIPKATNPKKIVVDFSSPNIAKEMHVGHLRSTIIGDTLSNLLEFSGHTVKRLNHIGDWGTQFGMLVEHLRTEYPAALSKETSQNVDLGDLVQLYKAAKKRFDDDDEFKIRAREGVVKLQSGDEESLAAWESLCAASRLEYQKIYDTLGIEGLEERGESFYNPYLKNVIEDLTEMGLAVPSEGAMAVFLDGYTNRDGTPLPMLVQKSDGGFNYATTDLAAIRHRVQLSKTDVGGEEADRVLYVTDAGQSQHFEMVFSAAKLAGFSNKSNDDKESAVSLEHVPFGLVQGEDGKKFATRSGDTVKLKDLLDEAVRIAGEDIRGRMDEGNNNLDGVSEEEIENVIRTVGISAVKYADLSMNRESNYKFSYGRMLSLNGNTAPYMLYAYARICSIVKKATGNSNSGDMVWPEPASEILITQDAERELIRNLIRLPDVLNDVENELYPHKLCDYLFETSQKFNQFYESCSVNKAETPQLKESRLSLCTVTASTIRLLLQILGIDVVQRL
eukprot:CAMPEP_0194355582 /NCGR_PEP_ID=MMETSP0174-20130528/3468_1 /TAXON_ID=216777 /ORGANISM="Proboscia alata, Strain PI-D3" /LENGTH=788 /DNA_ID=CAMNT_0039124911 /DNA_START=159 /DNA_END=2525 /DNA_ORIENTATION=+